MTDPLLGVIAEHANAMALKIYERTGRRGLMRISVDAEFGMCHGLIPGTTCTVYTCVGPVELHCEQTLLSTRWSPYD